MTRHRIVTWPWLRRLGGLVLPDWLAISLGHTVFAWRALTDDELEHVRQWSRMGWRYPIAYLAASLQARRAGGRWYRDNRFEVEARAAASRTRG